MRTARVWRWRWARLRELSGRWRYGDPLADLKASGQFDSINRRLKESTWKMRCEEYGEDNPDTLLSAFHFAMTLSQQGEHESARALEEDTLRRRRQVFGDDNPKTLCSASNLAVYRWVVGAHEQARTLAEDTLNHYRRALGKRRTRALDDSEPRPCRYHCDYPCSGTRGCHRLLI